MLVDQNTESVTVPLNANIPAGGRLELANSSLSEVAVLGVCAFHMLFRQEIEHFIKTSSSTA